MDLYSIRRGVSLECFEVLIEMSQGFGFDCFRPTPQLLKIINTFECDGPSVSNGIRRLGKGAAEFHIRQRPRH
jgi:hypothetical protein